LRIKEQETRLTLQEHDDNDDDYDENFIGHIIHDKSFERNFSYTVVFSNGLQIIVQK